MMKSKYSGSPVLSARFFKGVIARPPSGFSEFRTGEADRKGGKPVFGKNKLTGVWEIQSYIKPDLTRKRSGAHTRNYRSGLKVRVNSGIQRTSSY